jgi:dolichyl-phosphate beta-glucosyltransferase
VTGPAISVVIPAYNEEQGIATVVERVGAWLSEHDLEHEIIVVDNASEDTTVSVLAPLVDGKRVQLLQNDSNRGKGYSMRRGMLAATGDLRLHCDADCHTSLPSLELMLELIADSDVVVGSRLAPGAQVGRRQPLARRIVGRSFVDLCRLILREPTHDLFCGFKLWRADAAVAAYSRSLLDGWTFDAETLAMARALDYRIREVGIHWADRPGSRLSMRRVLLPVVRELVAARRHVTSEAARQASRPDRLVPEPAEPS